MQTLEQLAQRLNAELIGDGAAQIFRACPFAVAGAGDLTFATSAVYRARIPDSAATAIIVASPVEAEGKNLLLAKHPKLAFARAVQLLHAKPYAARGVSDDLIVGERTTLGSELSIYPRVTIGKDARIGHRVTLYPGVVIGDRCHIGDDTVIYANVSVYDDCEIGNRVIIHAGTVIGADGFGFVADEDGRQVKLLQLGGVRIEEDCEIGACCAIDRAVFGETLLRRGVKLDNFIQVAHNSEIGEDTVIAAQTGFSGGTKLGKRCVIAGQVGTRDHIEIGEGAVITAKAAVLKDVPSGAVMSGTIPALDHNAWRRAQVLYSKLPELVARLRRLETIVRKQSRDTQRGDE